MNKLKEVRESMLFSKSELARKAGVTTVTINSIENGCKCRMTTIRKILEALGLGPEDRDKVFDEEGQ